MRFEMESQRLFMQGALAIGVLVGATFLAYAGIITSDAVVGIYGAALGAVAGGAVGGTRSGNAQISHTHSINGGDITGSTPPVQGS